MENTILVDDPGDNSRLPSTLAWMTMIQIPDQLRLAPNVIWKLLFDEVRSCYISFMVIPLVRDPVSCSILNDVHSMLFQ